MLTKLTNFNYKRTFLEAVLFYIAYLILLFLLTFSVAASLSSFIAEFYLDAHMAGVIIVTIGSIILSFLILLEKNLLGNFPCLLTVLLAGFLAFLFGAFVGMIPVAFLTTKQPKSIDFDEECNHRSAKNITKPIISTVWLLAGAYTIMYFIAYFIVGIFVA